MQAGGILTELIPADEQEHVAVFVISSNGKKIIYAPCDVKPFPKSEKFQGADVLIIGNTIVGGIKSKKSLLRIWKRTGENLMTITGNWRKRLTQYILSVTD